MDFSRIRKTTIFSLLITFLFALMPVEGIAVPQRADISKPTRERVRNNDKKQSDAKDKKDNKSDAAGKNEKSAATAAAAISKKDTKQAIRAPKGDDKKETQPAAKPDEKPDAKAPATEKKPEPKPAPVVSKNYNGIDVSKYQKTIDWDVVSKDKKIQYVYIKATEGSDLVDERYQQNLRNARRVGIKAGSYHYLSTRSSVTNQFKNFARTAQRDEQDLIPVIDVEVCKPWSAQQLRDSLKVFANMLEDYYGCKPIIYTYESFFKNYLGKAFADYPIFIAKYSRTSDELPNINGLKWILWQYSDNGRVNGINAKVDLSQFNKGHNINDILYRPSKHKPRVSVMDAVDRNKPKPITVKLMDQPKTKEEQAQAEKQKEEAEKRAAKQKRAEERKKKLAEEEAKVKAEKEKAEKAKADRAKANRAKAEKAKAEKAKAEKEKADKAKAEKAKAEKARAEKAKAEAEAKAKRKAEAQKARTEKAKQEASKKANKTNKSASISAKLTQSQRNDSIRAARQQGRKINKSSADND